MKGKRLRASLRIVLVAAALGAALTAWPALRALTRSYGCPRCNVVLVSIDTLRADHVGCYGYARPTTPHIDAFAADAVRFANAIAQGSTTAYSHGSMFTALIPQHHGASWTKRAPIRPYAPILPQILTAAGWISVSFNGGALLGPHFGFARGFAVYDSDPQARLAERADAAIEWLRHRPARPFFLFLHSYEVHHPYLARDPYFATFDRGYGGALPRAISVELLREINTHVRSIDDADLSHIIDAYDAGIRSADDGFQRLLDFLKESRLYDDTLIVLTGDHGEELGERGIVGWHSQSVHDEILRVPLLVKFPRSWHAGKVVERQVSHVDILPTILDVLDLAASSPLDGQSLVGEIGAGARDERPVISQCDDQKNRATSVRTRQWKLLLRKGDSAPQLYDLGADPGETTDVAPAHESVVAELRRDYEEVVAAQKSVIHPMQQPLEEKVKEQLRALGYEEGR